MLSGLLSVDIILLVTWQMVDPLRREIETFSLELPPFGDEDAMIKPELEHCSSEHYDLWIGECVDSSNSNMTNKFHTGIYRYFSHATVRTRVLIPKCSFQV